MVFCRKNYDPTRCPSLELLSCFVQAPHVTVQDAMVELGVEAAQG